ncbi:MAG: hypothetical protein SH820_02910 [Xanthomonadales bacterium]|nr:hypothetical protein [Xanthomonadales bacterium]
MKKSFLMLISVPLLVAGSFVSQAASADDLTTATIIHYEAVGVVSEKHVQIPPTDADLYADISDKVSLSFDWNKDKNEFVGTPEFKNYPGTATNLMGMDEKCPTGKINGAYEHFDIVEVKPGFDGGIELIGKRIHPETQVAESCGAGLRTYPGKEVPVTEYTVPLDPAMLMLMAMMPADGPITASADGKSLIMKTLNDGWVWTYTPSVK